MNVHSLYRETEAKDRVRREIHRGERKKHTSRTNSRRKTGEREREKNRNVPRDQSRMRQKNDGNRKTELLLRYNSRPLKRVRVAWGGRKTMESAKCLMRYNRDRTPNAYSIQYSYSTRHGIWRGSLGPF